MDLYQLEDSPETIRRIVHAHRFKRLSKGRTAGEEDEITALYDRQMVRVQSAFGDDSFAEWPAAVRTDSSTDDHR